MTGQITTGASAVAGAPRSRKRGELVFVGVIVVFAGVALVMTGFIREPVGSSNILGARVVPYAVTGLMLLSSLAAFVAVLRGDIGAPDEGEDIDTEARTSWRTVIFLALAFASLMVVIPVAGWPAAVVVLFAGASLALGASSWWKALLLGLGLGVLTQLLFGTLLGLSLPPFGTIVPGLMGSSGVLGG
ncbi:tripartite tricarboxylate transporter TctB family protein [Microbacterium sp. TWP3-1-2b2]|uniref:tripartite tricarboxylate transporter TctB family protein n=1 Tax=Microbacterium sp. TWP3-1-2b2 TaxID=2804651 RepID=UPI003CF095CC